MYIEWDKIEKICTNDALFDHLFGSIKSLSFDDDGMALLGKMPVEKMFGMDSQLETMKLNHYWNDSRVEYFQVLVKEFEEKYISLQNDIKKQGKQMKRLKVVEHRNGHNVVVLQLMD